jgi:hypothetical protein
MRGVDYVHHNVALVPLAKAGRRYWTVNVANTCASASRKAARACGASGCAVCMTASNCVEVRASGFKWNRPRARLL